MTERAPAGDVYGDEFFKCPTCGCVDWWPRESDGKKLCLACVPLLPGVIETPIAIDDRVELLNSEDNPYTAGRVVAFSPDRRLVFTKSEGGVVRANGWPAAKVQIKP